MAIVVTWFHPNTINKKNTDVMVRAVGLSGSSDAALLNGIHLVMVRIRRILVTVLQVLPRDDTPPKDTAKVYTV
jgi:hypothetical protein